MRLTKKLSDTLNVKQTNATDHLVEYGLKMPGGSLGGLREKQKNTKSP